jgi:hypothetical protein
VEQEWVAQELQARPEEPENLIPAPPKAKVENCFLIFFPPHFGQQTWLSFPWLTRASKFRRHFAQWYSKIGISIFPSEK